MLQALTPGVATGTATGAAAPDYTVCAKIKPTGLSGGVGTTCQEVLASLPDYAVIAPHLHELAATTAICSTQAHPPA
jgi:hypothetical protein